MTEKEKGRLAERPDVTGNTNAQEISVDKSASQGSRDIREARAWLWADKSAVRRIREAFETRTFLDQGLAVYFVLCELASNEEGPKFTISRRTIAERSGVSIRRVSEILAIFRRIKLLEWTQNKIAGTQELSPNSFTLLSCTPCTTLGTGSTRLGTERKRHFCTVLEETTEETSEEISEERSVAAATPPARKQNDQEWIAGLKADPAYEGIDVGREHAKASRWCLERRRKLTRRFFVGWLNRTDPPLSAALAKPASANPANRGINEVAVNAQGSAISKKIASQHP